jgi:ferritin-like metal-binding protein YciE
MKLHNLEDLFIDQVRDLFDAEKQLVKALPKVAKAASSEELKTALQEHLEQTRGHVQRLERVFELVGKAARGKSCKGMEGIIEEGSEVMEMRAEPMVLDAGLISAAQRVEHYEISGYGTLCAWARQLGMEEAVRLLEQTLAEEKAADQKLNQIAESMVNVAAEEHPAEEQPAEQPSAEQQPAEQPGEHEPVGVG